MKPATALIAAGGLAFTALAALVSMNATQAFDYAVISWFRVKGDLSRPLFSDLLIAPMTDITALGGYTALTMLTLGAALCYAVLRQFLMAALVILAIGSSGLLTFVLKMGFDRVRPDLVDHLTHSTNSSFPSGHALQSTVAFLLIGALLARAPQNRPLRRLILTGAVLLTLLVGVSRIYLGVHWPTDVLAGWCLGVAWTALWWTVLRRFSAR